MKIIWSDFKMGGGGQSSAEMVFRFANEDVRFLTFPDEKNGKWKDLSFIMV